MRFKRADLPGMIFAIAAPVLGMLLLLSSYQLWHHHGTPLLGMLSSNIAIGAGLLAGFFRFVRNRDALVGLLLALVVVVVGVLLLRASGNDGTFADILKVVGLVIFGLLNVFLIQQLLFNGLGPILDRRDERAAAEAEAAEPA